LLSDVLLFWRGKEGGYRIFHQLGHYPAEFGYKMPWLQSSRSINKIKKVVYNVCIVCNDFSPFVDGICLAVIQATYSKMVVYIKELMWTYI
jgi:hypothetical protein